MRGSILIIGSLLWDNSQRDAWRKARLDVERGLHVKVPIGYYRRSASRDSTFTMTLATDAPAGQAVLVPCRLPMESVEDLEAEARALWKAERKAEPPKAAPNVISAAWGTVGVLFAPSVRSSWRTKWASYFRSHGHRVPPMNDAGVLELVWPATAAAGAAVDVEQLFRKVAPGLRHRDVR